MAVFVKYHGILSQIDLSITPGSAIPFATVSMVRPTSECLW
jgi:hypothetical protein